MRWVYFLHSSEKKFVKIGFTNNLQRRVRELQSEHGPLAVVHLIDSDATEVTTKRLEVRCITTTDSTTYAASGSQRPCSRR